ncbi:MAG: metalloregulator ArsR/SmtB family transcription factor [Saprospiraceae bacterium]|jgi:ArsR family transcriptional regulator|nr:metalloregulator ArsR/SmtB family transcription factor [Saprospiraceae bacterium]
MRKAKVSINDDKLQASSEILRALAHPLRMQILEFIDQHETINVNKIYNTLKLEQSITSQHLRILRSAGIVLTVRDGKFIHYKVDYDKVGNATKAIGEFLSTFTQDLDLEDDDDEDIS